MCSAPLAPLSLRRAAARVSSPSPQARFEPLHDKYKMLEHFEVSVPEEQQALLEALSPAWSHFCSVLDEMANRLEKYKDNFREKVKSLLDSFLKEVGTSSEEFFANAPYSFEVATADALASLKASRDSLASLRKRVSGCGGGRAAAAAAARVGCAGSGLPSVAVGRLYRAGLCVPRFIDPSCPGEASLCL